MPRMRSAISARRSADITGQIGVDDAVTRAARQVAELLGAPAG